MRDVLIPRARLSDPSTSHAAAQKAKAFAWSHRDRILGCMWREMTAAEIAKCTALTVVQVDRRMIELERAQEVMLTGAERGGMREWRKVLTASR